MIKFHIGNLYGTNTPGVISPVQYIFNYNTSRTPLFSSSSMHLPTPSHT